MFDAKRRRLLVGGAGAGVALLVAGAAGFPTRALAALKKGNWPKKAFNADSLDKTIDDLYGQAATESDKITLDLPTIAQNGAVVPFTVESSLPNVDSISVLVAKNPNALAASFLIPKGTEPYISNRIKMAETSAVVALVQSDGKLYKASKNVKVTVGGCGG